MDKRAKEKEEAFDIDAFLMGVDAGGADVDAGGATAEAEYVLTERVEEGEG